MRFVYIALLLGAITGAGVVGYVLIEGWSFSDAFFMTIISLTTVGYGEVHHLSPAGRYFTAGLLLLGVGAVFYASASVAEAMFEGRVRQILGRRKRVRDIRSLEGHHIVCGYGRIGFIICRELSRESLPFVIIEKDPEKAARLNEQGFLVIVGDATSDSVLAEAGITRAKTLICTLPTDAENVFATLSARGLNSSVFIVSRAARESSIPKIEAAGANRVISPYTMGGMRMVETILRPKLAGFLDEVAGFSTADLDLEEVTVPESSDLAGRPLRESRLSQETGVYLIAARRKGGRMDFNPGPDYRIEPGDRLYAIGRSEQVASLRSRVERIAGL